MFRKTGLMKEIYLFSIRNFNPLKMTCNAQLLLTQNGNGIRMAKFYGDLRSISSITEYWKKR